tara:strand:+ start:4404 stop:5048 length:645 start_codon:yes stop_codon:yes gene_type:complete
MNDNIKNRFKEGDSIKSDNISPITIFYVVGFLVLFLTIQGINEDTRVDISELKTDIESLTLKQRVLAIQSDNSTITTLPLKNNTAEIEQSLNEIIENQKIISNRLQKIENKNKKIENRITEVENYLISRLKKLEKSTATTNSKKTYNSISDSEKNKNKSNWRKIYTGMTRPVVREILGEPLRISTPAFEEWKYPNGGQVKFYINKVVGWTEPKW